MTASGTILDRIVSYKREEVAHRRACADAAILADRIAAAPAPRGFHTALVTADKSDRFALICEIKKASPSKGLIRPDFDPPAHARDYEAGGAACISILTDGPSFQGDDSFLVTARAACALPVLRKDFMVDPWQVRESRALGADCILVIMACTDDMLASALTDEAMALGMDVLVEVHDAKELARALKLDASAMIGVNNRDLRSFSVDLGLTARLAPLVPKGRTLVAESGIDSQAEIATIHAAGARAFLIGESLMRKDNVTAATRQLVQR
jgi:indole-3-glycerol phosphate synthase